MINERIPISMAESAQYLSEDIESEIEVKKFIKKFTKMDAKKAVEMKKELEGLEIMRLRPEHVVKIIDTLPRDSDNLNKIFEDVKLDEDETNKILKTVEKFK